VQFFESAKSAQLGSFSFWLCQGFRLCPPDAFLLRTVQKLIACFLLRMQPSATTSGRRASASRSAAARCSCSCTITGTAWRGPPSLVRLGCGLLRKQAVPGGVTATFALNHLCFRRAITRSFVWKKNKAWLTPCGRFLLMIVRRTFVEALLTSLTILLAVLFEPCGLVWMINVSRSVF
jgi:hypothetical protein